MFPSLYDQVHLRRNAMVLLFIVPLLFVAACGSSGGNDNVSSSIVVVSSPAAGTVKRVLVPEGVDVEAGTTIIEIVGDDASKALPSATAQSAETKAVTSVKSAESEIDAARAEVVKHQSEIERLTPLVASGSASAAQLDGERALYDRAQQRLQKAEADKRNADTSLLAARQPNQVPSQIQGQGQSPAATTRSAESVISVKASSAGTVSVISARVGDHVAAGQPLATVRVK